MDQPFVEALEVLNALPGNHLIVLPDAPRFTIVAVTDAYLKVTYTTREGILGKGIFEAFPDDSANLQATGVDNLTASLHQVIQRKEIHQMAAQRYDVFNPHTGGFEQKVWKPVNQPVLNEAGDLRYIIHTVEDITNSVQLVELTEANQYMQTIINGFKEPLQVLEPIIEKGQIIDFRFKLTNQAYASYAQATPEQLQGKRVGEVFPGYFETESFTNPVLTFTTGQPLTFEIHYDKDGLDLYNLMSTSKLDNEVVIHFTDFTRLRQLQLQLESKIDELKRSNDSLQQFAYVASHDLQEPLRKIQSFSSILQQQFESQFDDGGKHLLHRMQLAAERMAILIKDLLTYSRLSTGQALQQPVSLNGVVNQVLDNLSLLVEESRAELDIEDLPVVQGDEMQLGQLFQNLLSNAVKFTRPGEKPQISVRYLFLERQQLPFGVNPRNDSTHFHQITVSDRGIGFDTKYLDRIFQVFQRLHGKNEYAGTGVGLAICQRVVQNHGGVITASSRPGEGATFTVYLPG
ncbi:ATP-binding protein [Larkinella insperata]|uniref:histidine kinase n=1 Tax=Larkinella insperata TaxID=332158 RepID=A0ABW3Q7C7_9BACT